jgi:tetratricopeptide (TPR) repeat protein
LSKGIDTAKLAELQELLAQESVSSIDEYLRQLRKESPQEAMLWRHCAFPLSFDQKLFEDVLRKGLAPDTPDFKVLISSVSIEPVPRTKGVYRMRNAARVERLDEWLKAEPELNSLRALADEMLAYFNSEKAKPPQFERLRCLVVTQKNATLDELQALFREADQQFDLASCQALVDMLRELDSIQAGSQSVQLKLLTPELRGFCDDKLQYIQRRQLFTEEYYRTINYFQRDSLFDAFQKFLRASDKWIFDIYATGGMGKTMFLRWLMAHYCVPRAIPVARIDFDFIRVPALRDAPWLVLLPAAEQLNIQIPEQPFGEYLADGREFGLLLQPPEGLPPGTDIARLENRITSGASAWRQQWVERFITKSSGTVLILLDTLEEAILHYPDALVSVLTMFRQVHQSMPQLRMVLSGRYWMGERGRLPYFTDVLAKETSSVKVPPFIETEAESYLVSKRSLSREKYPLPNLVRKAGGIPMTLSLLADIALQYESLTAKEVDEFKPEFEYLIRRIINRIPERDGDVRWVIRYGAIARRLTRDFIREVLYPHLERERKRNSSDIQDNVKAYSDSWKAYELRGIDELWSRLGDYASGYGWLRPTAQELRFEPEVIHPMRKLLSQETIFQTIHNSAAEWFKQRAARDSANWGDLMVDAIYHLFEANGPEAAPFWQECIATAKSKGNMSVVRSLIRVPIGPDFVDGDGNPFRHFKDWTPVDHAILGEAYFQDAELTCLQQVETPELSMDWTRVREQLRRAQFHQDRSKRRLFSDEARAMVHICIELGEHKFAMAAAHAVATQAKVKSPRVRFILAMQAGIASEAAGDSGQALQHYRNARDFAQTHTITFPAYVVPHRLGRLQAKRHQFYAAEREYQEALRLAKAAKASELETEITVELANLYLSGWRFQQAVRTLSSLRSDLDPGSLHSARALLLRAACLFHQQYLLDALELLSGLSSLSSLTPLLYVQLLELSGAINAALFDYPAAEQLEEASSRYAVLGDEERAARASFTRICYAIECEGNYRGAARLITRTEKLSEAGSRIQSLIYRLQLAYIQSKEMPGSSLAKEVLAGKTTPLDHALLWAAVLAFSSGDATGIAMSLADALEAVEPNELRLKALRPFRYRKEPIEIPRGLAKRLKALTKIESKSSRDFPTLALAVVDFLRVLSFEGTARKLLEDVMSIQKNSPSLIALREILGAGERLGIPLPAQEVTRDFSARIRTHGLSAVIQLEDDLRRTGRVESENIEPLFPGIDKAALQNVRSTQWDASRFVLTARFQADSAPDNIHAARNIYEKLGMPPHSALAQVEEELKHGQGLTTYRRQLAEAQRTGDQQAQGMIMSNLALMHAESGELKRAIELYQQALEIHRKAGNSAGESEALNHLGMAYAALGDYGRAIELSAQSLAVVRNAAQPSGDRRNEVSALSRLGALHAQLGEPLRAIEFYEQALKIQSGRKDRRDDGALLSGLGAAYGQSGDFKRAIELYQQALPIQQEIRDTAGMSSTLGNLGAVYAQMNDFRRAIDYYSKALELEQQMENPQGASAMMDNLGLAYIQLRDFDRATDWLRQALAIQQKIGARQEEGLTLGYLGHIHLQKGDAHGALTFYEQSLKIKRETADRRGEGQILVYFGHAHAQIGNKRQSIESYEKALAIQRELGNRYDEGQILVYFALAYMQWGEPARAIELYESALTIKRDTGDRFGEAQTLDYLGSAHLRLGQHARAIDLYRQAVKIKRDSGDRRGELVTLENLGLVYQDLGDLPRVIELSRSRLAIATEIGDAEGQKTAKAMLDRANAEMQNRPGERILILTPSNVPRFSIHDLNDWAKILDHYQPLARGNSGELESRLTQYLTIPLAGSEIRFALRMEDVSEGALPWELAFPPDRICFRFPARRTPGERGLSVDGATSRRTVILESSTESQELVQRGFHRSRINLWSLYSQMGMAEVVTDPSPNSVIEAFLRIRPHIVHIRAGFRFSPSAGLQIEFSPMFASKGYDQMFFNTEALGKALSMNADSAPLIILDPPRPPDRYEAALQLLYRNLCAAELFEIAPCHILAIGMTLPELLDGHASSLLETLQQRPPLADILQLFRQRLPGDIFSTQAAALFTHNPDLHLA